MWRRRVRLKAGGRQPAGSVLRSPPGSRSACSVSNPTQRPCLALHPLPPLLAVAAGRPWQVLLSQTVFSTILAPKLQETVHLQPRPLAWVCRCVCTRRVPPARACCVPLCACLPRLPVPPAACMHVQLHSHPLSALALTRLHVTLGTN